ncbi:MAG: peptidoglycan-binding protein [Clostridium sp.]
MNIGFIKVNVSTAREALPIKNAKVVISKEGYRRELITNESGQSEIIEVPAPPKDLSLMPKANLLPYEVYNIDVSAVGYKDYHIKGVQVFDREVSIQQVEMIPMSKEKGAINDDTVVISQHGLVTPGIRNQIGPSKTGYLLKNVQIPEYITVHLGSPTSYAENVTVTFPEYIKNVASSEIYPTWPENAIRANVYAQISFALNRVYTEWYRSKGYDFQITNSTAYDQYFVKGRNIFENISRIVDSIFNEYIKRYNQKNPLFSQYCNGTTVTCKGLSQWGTVDLANSGYTPFKILQYYYGNDIELVRTSNVEGIPESYPGYSLKLGSKGEDVKTIQKQLNRIGKNYPAIKRIDPVDGNFGKSTEDAVKVFQEVFNLSKDGIVGRATWYKINQIYVGVKNLAELESEGEIIEGETSGIYPGYLIKEGMRGKAVGEIQYYLKAIGEFYDELPIINADGIFGPATKNAVISFQKKFGLSPDGIVGPLTWNKIYEVYKSVQGQIEESPDSEYPGYLIKEGARGNEVEKIQTYLKGLSYKYPSITRISVDGIFGKNTKKAVTEFQSLFDLKVDGIVGPATWNKLYEEYRKIDSTRSSLPVPVEYPDRIIKYKDELPQVKIIQTYLKEISDIGIKIGHVEVRGDFDDKTLKSVKRFQEIFKLPVTGIIDKETWDKIVEIYSDTRGKRKRRKK